MTEWLSIVLSTIADGTLLPGAHFEGLNCVAALDHRDEDTEFDTAWDQAFAEVERRWASANIPGEARTLVEDIRRESFLAVFRPTRHHEMASCVSDDFDLIVRSRLTGLQNGFLDRLWEAYQRGEFTHAAAFL